MKSENLPNSRNGNYVSGTEVPDDDALAGGKNWVNYILLGLIMALIVGYIALPKGPGTEQASEAPAAVVENAEVSASAPAAPAKAAASTKATDESATEEEDARPVKIAAKTSAATAAAPGAAVVAEPTDAAMAPAQEAASMAPAAEPAAPTSVTVTGRMEDENGHPLVGATVLLKGSSKGTSTDANGNYSLEVPAGNDNNLIYGYGGYDDEVVHVSGSKPLNVILTPRAKAGRHRR
jgi:hypothetical protein